MSTFQRARNEEQREIRRRAILETAAAMMGEMPVAAVSLNELSRRVGLAKSNVLRYFESREAILLDLLSLRADSLLERIAEQLPGITGPVRSRVAGVASALAKEFAADPMLCELLSAQAGVLEHNVSAETVAQYKRDGYRILASAAATLQQVLPELGDAAAEAVRTLLVLAGALWTHAHPPQAVRDAYAADPSLVFLPEGFVRTLDRTITLVLLGILASGE
ncbi:TetR/AcrR family transcriptional regulator [Amycolatopsis benzoatilytica]|uniref:TetR/AcrR family transcriptional regulator n=1 Tax=Amycolatopsis benzoatilytica TaxID=346045 RepID=UPI000370B152|nr:TetR family transcriptional regulator [Amycolatopsis benzoatilytica]